MTKVAILPVPTKQGDIAYCAMSGDKQTQGRTAGKALDALTAQLSEDESGTLIIVQSQRPDRFFGATQQKRLAELMERWRAARDRGETLLVDEQSELEAIVEAELHAAGERIAALVDEFNARKAEAAFWRSAEWLNARIIHRCRTIAVIAYRVVPIFLPSLQFRAWSSCLA